MDCSKITAGLVAGECDKQPIAGTAGRVILLNYADIDKAASIMADNVLSEIHLKGAAKGYAYESLDDTTTGEFSLNKGTYFSNWQHDVTLRIFAKTAESKDFVNSLRAARVVAIVENHDTTNGGAVKYEVYGWDSGLELNEGTGSTEYADSVIYNLQVGSGELSKEGTIPKTFFNTDEQTTDLAIAAVLA